MKYAKNIEIIAELYRHKLQYSGAIDPQGPDLESRVQLFHRGLLLSSMDKSRFQSNVLGQTVTFCKNGALWIDGVEVDYQRDAARLKDAFKDTLTHQFSTIYQEQYLPLKKLAASLGVETDLCDTLDAYLEQYLHQYQQILPLFKNANDLIDQFGLFHENLLSIFVKAAQAHQKTEQIGEKIALILNANVDAIQQHIPTRELPALLFLMGQQNPEKKAAYQALGQTIYEGLYHQQSKLFAFLADGHKKWCEKHPFLKPVVTLVVALLTLFVSQQRLENSVVVRDYSAGQIATLNAQTSASNDASANTTLRFFMPRVLADEVDTTLKQHQPLCQSATVSNGIQRLMQK